MNGSSRFLVQAAIVLGLPWLGAWRAAPTQATGNAPQEAQDAGSENAPARESSAELAARVRAVFDTTGRDVANGADFTPSPGYRELVAALLAMKPQDVAAQSPEPLDLAAVLADPESARGRWVSARGTVNAHMEIPLDPPVAGIAHVDRAIFMLGPEKAVVCDLIGDPPPYKNQRDTLQVSGVLYRTVGYESGTKKQVVVPYLLVRSMELVDTPASTLGKSLLHGWRKLAGGILIGLVGAYLFVWYLRKSARSSD